MWLWAPTEIGQNVEAKFRSFAKSIMYYEKRWFSGWSESINSVAMQHLKQPIFKRSAETGGAVRAAVEGGGGRGALTGLLEG